MLKITGKAQRSKFVEGLWGPVLFGVVLVCDYYGAVRSSYAVLTTPARSQARSAILDVPVDVLERRLQLLDHQPFARLGDGVAR